MKKVPLTRKGAMLHGALTVLLAPRLAADAKFNLAPFIVGITDKNYAKRKGALVTNLTKALKPVLATDASAEGLAEIIDALEKVPQMEGKDDLGTMPNSGLPLKAEGEDDDFPPEDDEDEEQMAKYGKVRDMMKKAGMDEETMAGCDAEMGWSDDADPAQENAEGEEEEDDVPLTPPSKDKHGKDKKMAGDKRVTRVALDKALATQRKTMALDAKNLREAERFVRDWVGDVDMACDSAVDVFKLALETVSEERGLDIDLAGVHPSAYRSMLSLLPKRSENMAQDESFAEDDAPSESNLYKLFPVAKRAARV